MAELPYRHTIPFSEDVISIGLALPVAQTPELLVVGGAMRSGTTLLQRVLESHAAIRLMKRELRVLRYADMASWAHAAAVHQSFLTPLSRVRDAPFRRQVYRYLGHILRGHRLGELTTIDRIHDALTMALAGPETRYVGDKYPDYLLAYPAFIHRPHTRCVFIHRDPRDVVASILERIHHGDWQHAPWTSQYDTLEKATNYWCSIMATLGDLRRLEADVLIIRYEDLVRTPARVTAQLAHYLDLPAEGFDATAPHDRSMGRHQDRLTSVQIKTVEARAASLMEAWDYPLT